VHPRRLEDGNPGPRGDREMPVGAAEHRSRGDCLAAP
jgi:hypothetical protein